MNISKIIGIFFACVVLAGCGSSTPAKPAPSQVLPSRSQALQDYKTEVELLDRLEAKRKASAAERRASSENLRKQIVQLPENAQQPLLDRLQAQDNKGQEIEFEEIREVANQEKRVREAAEVLKTIETSTQAK